jgi:hypothetical protein
VQIGGKTIDINSVINNLSAATSNLDAAAISALTTTIETAQATTLASAWK